MAKISAAMVKELRTITGAAMMDCKQALTETDGDLDAAKEILRKKGQAIANKKSSRETKEGGIATKIDGAAAMVKVACETDFVAINDKFKSFLSEVASQVIELGAEGYSEKTTEEGTAPKEFFTDTIAGLGENIVYLDGVKWDQKDNTVFGSYVHSNGKIGVLVELESANPEGTEVAKEVAMHIAASQVEAISSDELDPAILEKEKAFLIDQAKDSGKPENIIEKMVMGRLQKFKKEICLLDQPFVKSPDLSISQLLKQEGKKLGTDLKVVKFEKFTF